jgi:DNA polymerase-3 subunit delta'
MLFKEIIGHLQIKEQLVKSVHEQRISHAQLFYGKPGSTSFALALAYAQYASCEKPSPTDSCGVCSRCKQFAAGSYPDLNYSFPVSNNSEIGSKPTSDSLRNEWEQFLGKQNYIPALNDWQTFNNAGNKQALMTVHESALINHKASLKSYSGGLKVFLIWLPELFHAAAANKLLKTIEEPEPNTLILLVSQDVERVLQTITSRCQKLYVPLYQEAEVAQWLQQQNVDGSVAQQAATLAEGNTLEALRIAEDSARFHEYAVLFRDWMRACLRARVAGILDFVDVLAKKDRETIKEALTFYIQTIELALSASIEGKALNHPLFMKASFDLNKFAPFINAHNAGPIHKELTAAYRDVSRNVNPRIILSDSSFKMSRFLKTTAS